MSRQDIDLTIDACVELLLMAAVKYSFLRFAETSNKGEFALWRLDVDFSSRRALALLSAYDNLIVNRVPKWSTSESTASRKAAPVSSIGRRQ